MSRLQECPAITALKQALVALPSVRRDTLVDARPATRHTSGLAIDIFFNSKVEQQKQRGLELIDVLVKHQKAMQWSDLIFTNFHIGGGIGGYMGDGRTRSSWTGGGHDDHIHLDWVDRSLRSGPDGSPAFIDNPWEHSAISRQTGWAGPLRADLQGLASGWASGATGASAPCSNTQWANGWWVVHDGNYYYYFSGQASTNRVTYTESRSANARIPPPKKPFNEGKVTLTTQGLIIDWNPADGGATRETFTRRGSSESEMSGVSNRYGPLTAKKMT